MAKSYAYKEPYRRKYTAFRQHLRLRITGTTFLESVNFFFATVLLIINGCSKLNSDETGVLKSDFTMMGTYVSIQVEIPKKRMEEANIAIDIAKHEMQSLVDTISSWDSKSDTSLINTNAGIKPVKIDSRLMEVLLQAQDISELSNGAFDITFSPLGQLWNLNSINPVIPDDESIARALNLVGFNHLELDTVNGTAFLQKKGMRIDLGAIAKGAVVDAGIRSLCSNSFKNVLIEAGGDIYARGAKSHKPWHIGITNPRNKRGPVIGKLSLSNQAVATSGDYEKSVFIKGKRYNHIIDPRTGRPAGQCMSVTVIAKKASTADALATAFFILGPQKALVLCERLSDTETAIIDITGSIHTSRGFPIQLESVKGKENLHE